MSGKISKISGSIVTVTGLSCTKMADMVTIGPNQLIGEVVGLTTAGAWVQVYESTHGLKTGDAVTCTCKPLEIELGPGLLGAFLDGLGRPWPALYAASGGTVAAGIRVPSLDRAKRCTFNPSVTVGAKVSAGDVIGTVQETRTALHKISVPAHISGTVAEVHSGERTVEETVVIVKGFDGTDHKLSMAQRRPLRIPAPIAQRHLSETLLKTGAAEFDGAHPLTRGGTALLSASGGAKSTLLDLIQGADADVIVYVNCGGRGAEIASFQKTLSEQTDAKGEALDPRIVHIASPADSPAAACEISIYTGLTIASYFRDMGQHVLLIADSLDAWIGALSATGGLIGSAAYEGGPPTDISTRLGQFFAHAGTVTCLGGDNRQGSLTLIGIAAPDMPGFWTNTMTRLPQVVWEQEEDHD